jgi:uncharacterized membrane protein
MPGVRSISAGQAFTWLGAGWRDLRAAPVQSGFYGVVFAVVGWLALGLLGQLAYLVTAMISGFLLLAPFLAIGLYRISQQLETGQRPRLGDSMTAWRRNYGSIGLFAAFLGFAFIFWERISAILFALFHGLDVPKVDNLGGWIFLLSEDPVFLVLYVGLGAIAAATVFACSVVSIPLMLDRHVDPVTALITSVRATMKNRFALAVWAVTIVVLVAIGIATWFIGLVVIMPVLGHASWHAYRDLVDRDVGDPMY